MKVTRTGVFPQRQKPSCGWVDCEPHQATRWAALLRSKLVGRYITKELAKANLRQAEARAVRPRRYRLGSQMGKAPWL